METGWDEDNFTFPSNHLLPVSPDCRLSVVRVYLNARALARHRRIRRSRVSVRRYLQ